MGNYHHAQDLGSAGSCAKKFNTMPTTFCGTDNICRHSSRNAKSYWLTTSAAMPMMAINIEDVGQHISRCNVCEAPSTVIAVHSQTAQIPDCPAGFNTMWMGYSFLAHTSEGADGGGQDMASPGSCLEDFRATPFIECTGARGTCQFFSDSFSFWVRTINADQQFADPQLQALKGKINGRNQVSRCKVCVKSL